MLLVLSIDGLSAGALGCYGNDWIGTPAMDSLAAEGQLWDFAISDTPSLEALRSFWSGTSAASRVNQTPESGSGSLAALIEGTGGQSLLLTDDQKILEFPESAAFGEQVAMEMPGEPSPASDAHQTHLASFFANAAEIIHTFAQESVDVAALAWLHTSSLANVWDAPLEYRNRYRDEDDPPPPELAAAPHNEFPASDAPDPDELLGLRRAYAGQVALLDGMLGTFIEFLRESGIWDQTTFALTAPRGFGLGQHGGIGYPNGVGSLHEEYLHIPFLLRHTPAQDDANLTAVHEHRLFQPADFLPSLAQRLNLPDLRESSGSGDGVDLSSAFQQPFGEGRSLAFAVSPADLQSYAIRSAAWQLICHQHQGETNKLLFAKPDDRWEMNNVADRCPEVVAMLESHAQAILSGDVQASQAELDELLAMPH